VGNSERSTFSEDTATENSQEFFNRIGTGTDAHKWVGECDFERPAPSLFVCFGKQAEVTPQTTDRYGRTVARLRCDGLDVSEYQVRSGMAWVFDRCVKDRSLRSPSSSQRTVVGLKPGVAMGVAGGDQK
jgi:hypothetical protein